MDQKGDDVRHVVIPPCREACPAGVDVPRYIRAVRKRNYDEAVAVLREKLPLPTVCADACFAPCEEVCAYRQFGDPVAIRALKRAAMDKGGDVWEERKKRPGRTGKKVAIVGAGPAGLTAAYYLAGKGHEVTLFDSYPEPGGTMKYGIPQYRLPRERLDRDINAILDLGVVFKGNCTVGKEIAVDRLKEEFDALFLASGASRSVRIPLEGVDQAGVLWGLEFLRGLALGKKLAIDGDVIVLGGGNVAIDVALTAKRLGAKDVHLFCLEKRGEMPAHAWEIERAEEENIVIHNSWGPKMILGSGAVTGIILMRCTAVFDASGKFSPVYDEYVTRKEKAELIILAVGQKTDLGFIETHRGIDIAQGRVLIDEADCSAGERGIFAGGDVVNGPDSIIGAIAAGRRAAAGMDRYLGGDGEIEEELALPENEVFIPELPWEPRPRNDMALLKSWERRLGFDQVELGLGEEQIAAEAGRCLDCDVRNYEVSLNTEFCKACGYCEEVCGIGTFGPADFFNEKGYRPEEVKSSDRCVGCFKCYFACPDFAIDVKRATR